MSTQHRLAKCTECPDSYELIPPADPAYSVPKMKLESADHIKLFYECKDGHRNTIYWEKVPPPVIVTGSFESNLLKDREIYGITF